MLPSTFALQVVTGLWVGWNNHARWIRTSAPRRCGASSSFATSACAHWVLGACQFGNHRASPSMEVTPASEARDSTTLVPTLPVAPVITMCILGGSPSATIKRRRVAATTTVACPTRRLLWQVEAAARRALADTPRASTRARISAGRRGCDRHCGGYSTRAVVPCRAPDPAPRWRTGRGAPWRSSLLTSITC